VPLALATRNPIDTLVDIYGGDGDTQVRLRVLYSSGLGGHQDCQAAMKWYLKEAEQGKCI
jgi:TPR repeat protein